VAAAVANLIATWTINSARDLALNNCLLLWAVRHDPIARGLFLTRCPAGLRHLYGPFQAE
jgi:hypothetical protein